MGPWLAPVVTAFDEAAEPCQVFFRDDDAGWDDGRLGLLLDMFERHDLEVDVAVIPAALSRDLARDLRARGRGAGVRLHQHGWAHVNHEREGRKCEFGGARRYDDIAVDVGAGRRLLLEAFADHLDPVFTPPWNRCTDEVAQALVERGIKVLSRDVSAGMVDRASLAEVPVTVDWFGGRRGVRWTPDELGERLAASVRTGGPLGVMLHHAVCDDTDRAAIDDLLAVVTRHRGAMPTTIIGVAG